jgi:hypothetical protein
VRPWLKLWKASHAADVITHPLRHTRPLAPKLERDRQGNVLSTAAPHPRDTRPVHDTMTLWRESVVTIRRWIMPPRGA